MIILFCPGWVLVGSVPAFKYYQSWSGRPVCADSFGEKEAQVFCRELGYSGVETLDSVSFDEFKAINYVF